MIRSLNVVYSSKYDLSGTSGKVKNIKYFYNNQENYKNYKKTVAECLHILSVSKKLSLLFCCNSSRYLTLSPNVYLYFFN